jgi:hypothetical protein
VLSVAVAVCAGVVACFDVLHGTGELRTACEIDAAAPGCSGPAGPSACAPSAAEARMSAEHACAWLGACETPMGRNALGACMFAATAAFDCDANPGHPARGKQATLWRCLATAASCAGVDACIFPTAAPSCTRPGNYTGCAATSAEGGTTNDVRVECMDGGGVLPATPGGENCALWGLTCSVGATGGDCSPSSDPGCPANECGGGSVIHWCPSGPNGGIDCATTGALTCGGFPTRDAAAWVACIPSSDGGAPCAPDLHAACSGGVARACPAGVPETLDCAALLGAAPDAASCQAGPLSPPFDWTSPCVLDPPACTADSCEGGVANGCARGAVFSVSCSDVGLGPCSMRSTDLGTQQHATCTAPPR